MALRFRTSDQHVGCAEPCEAQPAVGGSCASYREYNLWVPNSLSIALIPEMALPDLREL
jgi:hypothetical protein